MTERRVLQPGPDHPITVEKVPDTVRVMLGDRLIAETAAALVLREADYPPVYYLPRADVEAEVLTASDHHTWCPFKGEASYHGLRAADGSVIDDTVWFYPAAHDAVAEITDHLAFYDDAVDVRVG